MYITSQQSYLSQINTRQTSSEACFDSKRKSIREKNDNVTVTDWNVEHYFYNYCHAGPNA